MAATQGSTGRGPSERGTALGMVLLAITLGTVLAFTLANTAVFHIRVMAHNTASQQAADMAESELAYGVSQFTGGPTAFTGTPNQSPPAMTWGHDGKATVYFYKAAEDSPLTESTTAPRNQFGEGILTFDPARSPNGVQASINNWSANPASGSPVPWTNPDGVQMENGSRVIQDQLAPGDCLLVTQATCEGVTHTAYAVISFPLFPYAIAAAGNINSSTGSLEVTGASGTSISPQDALASPDPNIQASIASNSGASGSGNSAAIDLSDLTRVTGTVQAVGTISVPQAVATGSIGDLDPKADAVPLPTIDVTTLNPTLASSSISGQTVVSDAIPSTIEGGFKWPQSSSSAGQMVTVSGLNLNQGVLYIDGNLHVQGAINGVGVIIVHGSVTVDDGSTFTAGGSQAAIIASGDVTLHGGATQKATFTGLVYSQGTFTASDITLMGGFVGTNPADPVTLTNVPGVVENADVTRFHLNIQAPVAPNGGPPTSGNAYFGPLGTNFTIYNDAASEPSDQTLPSSTQFWIGQFPQGNGGQSASTSGNPSQLDQAAADYLNSLGGYYTTHPATAKSVHDFIITTPNGLFSGNIDDLALQGTKMSVMAKPYPGQPSPSSTTITIVNPGSGNFDFTLNQFLDIGDTIRVRLWAIH